MSPYENRRWSTAAKENLGRLFLAGISCTTAAAVTNPIEVVKIRMQLDNELKHAGVRGVVVIAREEGIAGLYKGISPTLVREGVYSSIRMGAYEPMKQLLGATDPANTPFWKKVCAAALSGIIGSSLAVPIDVVKVRQQAVLPGKTGYPSLISAILCIYRTQGGKGLYVGTGPTIQRAGILTATQMPTYDHTKHTLLNLGWMQEGPRLHVACSILAGLMCAVTTTPVDVIKTRLMNQKYKDKYANQWTCVMQTLRAEGVLGLYKGFTPCCLRFGTHSLISLFMFEKLRHMSGIDPI